MKLILIPVSFTLLCLLNSAIPCFSQVKKKALGTVADKVNVFLGSSGDHGQLSPGASSPFGMLSIAPQTYPHTHTGYEYKAKKVLGFTHTRVEGVGCMGSGGTLLIKPFNGNTPEADLLLKNKEAAGPGYYTIGFENGIQAAFVTLDNAGIEQYHFPGMDNGFYLNLSHALANGFREERHTIEDNAISGWIKAGTTCGNGAFKVYYYLRFNVAVKWKQLSEHIYIVTPAIKTRKVELQIGISSADVNYARQAIQEEDINIVEAKSKANWNKALMAIDVQGDDAKEKALFYSLLYRTMQSPYRISEPDGVYRAIDGSLQKSKDNIYNGWSIWDNYKTQLPLLSLLDPVRYQEIIHSIANLYRYGKNNWATQTEPSNSVRTEHAIVVLLDAYRKGYKVDFGSIRDSLIKEMSVLDFTKPDKALESSYDAWAMAEILHILKEDSLSQVYRRQAAGWQTYWKNDFADIKKADVDKVGARGMYQGTIWQYRWFVPFDIKGLIAQSGGENGFLEQLDTFFGKDLYNHANEPDIQVPYLYNATGQAWKSQAVIRRYAQDTVVQYYFNDNSRGIDPFIDRVYRNQPDALIRTMDDDAGAMSAWYVLAASGLSPACVGWPVWYLHVPLFPDVTFNIQGKPFTIQVKNFAKANAYIHTVTLNGKPLSRTWLTQEEIMKGGKLVIEAAAVPNKILGADNVWLTALDKTGL
jgi:putative alpha-1,2-mannosidase